jgi:hypothetical protein
LLVIVTKTSEAFFKAPLAVKRGEGNSGVAVETDMSERIIWFAALASSSEIKSLMLDGFVTSKIPYLVQ